ncbi:hypothetical protein TSOC_008622 [Tetrabaena socialis]|uniref:Uncharacterized protein n=1 Tax=Tetrabaena socialis TaxID=47790 RepID=A0A2J7ZY47_9CHLO|nr:hypothetical protein TSOC_008622 [Tetrabaena socialis]|eukprot:PNH05186.1 hypothetical protein TSOC_008622 [Tetrabaena socialis]
MDGGAKGRRVAGSGGGSGLGAIAGVVRGLLADGGPAALYRGIGAATLRLVPMACVSFGTYEAVRALLVSWEQQREAQQVKQMLHSRCVPLVLRGADGGQEVVGRICSAPGAQPTLCGADTPSCFGAAELSGPLGAAGEMPCGTGAPVVAMAPAEPATCGNTCGATGAAAACDACSNTKGA